MSLNKSSIFNWRYLLVIEKLNYLKKNQFVAVLLLLFLLFVYIIDRSKLFYNFKEVPHQDLKLDDYYCQNNQAEFEFVSLCSCEADRRGLHQNVIAYSLYGNFSDPRHFSRYVEPIKIVLAKISQSYPEWVVRIYSALDHGNQVRNLNLKKMFAEYPFVDLCNVTRVLEVRNISPPLFPMTWRFLPLMDPLVDHFMSRDSDAMISDREVIAVNKWLTNSEATFHMMRDHPGHCAVGIIGGGWGAKVFQKRRHIYEASYKLFYETEHQLEYGFDQAILSELIWPLTFKDSLAHDSFCCYSDTLCDSSHHNCVPFPVRRQGEEHIGKPIHMELASSRSPVPQSCPERCRPPDHPEWIRC